jgi:hypothetical protein
MLKSTGPGIFNIDTVGEGFRRSSSCLFKPGRVLEEVPQSSIELPVPNAEIDVVLLASYNRLLQTLKTLVMR